MTRSGRGRRLWVLVIQAALSVGIGPPTAHAQSTAPAPVDPEDAYQVTLFGIIATPGIEAIDPKLARIEPQLRKLLPDHGFKLLDVRSKRLRAGESVRCDLGHGLVASTVLVRPLDENGKVDLRCRLYLNKGLQFDTLVATPPNQLFFCDRPLNNGTRLLIGVGAR